MSGARRIGEFELVARYFAPLASGFAGAGGLKNDNAFFPADGRHDLVVKTDAVIAGVHFLANEKPELVAAKALRVCLSDLAAGGASPFAYQLSLSLARGWRERWVAGFARGLGADQRRYGVHLSGGDTTQTPGPTTIAITAFGQVPRNKGIGRSGAKAGDELWVTGTVGDGALGLLAARGRLSSPSLEKRYRRPDPPVVLGPHLIDIASAAVDVSDGLLADAGHIAEASRVAVHIERRQVPLSAAAARAVASHRALWANVLGGGDDYQLLIALPGSRRAALLERARRVGVKVTPIGHLARGEGVHVTVAGRAVRSPRAGFVHF